MGSVGGHVEAHGLLSVEVPSWTFGRIRFQWADPQPGFPDLRQLLPR